jgi:hypothetical protein
MSPNHLKQQPIIMRHGTARIGRTNKRRADAIRRRNVAAWRDGRRAGATSTPFASRGRGPASWPYPATRAATTPGRPGGGKQRSACRDCLALADGSRPTNARLWHLGLRLLIMTAEMFRQIAGERPSLRDIVRHEAGWGDSHAEVAFSVLSLAEIAE